MFDKIKQLQQMKQQMDEVKNRLDNITVKGEAENGKVVVLATGNRTIKEVQISPDLLNSGEVEQVNELVLIATNRALESALNASETEMKSVSG